MIAAAADSYRVELAQFEGPLDLLLHLVRKHELDIVDIPIAFVTEKYLEYLEYITHLDLDVAGEYLLMAATLAHIKSCELLPNTSRPEEELEVDAGEDIDPRAELIKRLLEYQKYKDAAQSLAARPIEGRNVFARGQDIEHVLPDGVDAASTAPLAQVPVIRLIEAFDRVLKRAKIKLTHEVKVERLSVSERIGQLVDRLERERAFSFASCFPFLAEQGVEVSAAVVRHEAVVTFLALLEMAKLGLIKLSQQFDDAEQSDEPDIYISAASAELRERMHSTIAGNDDYR